MLEIAPKFEWLPVMSEGSGLYRYPAKQPAIMQQPAIYRWVLTGADGNRRFLVGETDNHRERMQSYLGSSAKSHQNIRKTFQETCDSGGKVELEMLRFEPFSVNGTVISADRLASPFVRLILENLCCAQIDPAQLLNSAGKRLIEVQTQRAAESERMIAAIAKLSPVEKAALVAKLPEDVKRNLFGITG